ncbi:GAF and ANTAR domain-containing protein [Amycolatopsis sp. NPDC059657]|uniref:GAF and ANTAR domain-containing protein n=1 Tax=Amycolatopsis sp. NPDC059657 TaxID=3346899 RepID=UPI00367217DE
MPDDPPRFTLGPELLDRLLEHLAARVGSLGAALSTADGQPRVIRATGDASEFEALQAKLDEGPTKQAVEDREVVHSADLRHDERWPQLARALAAREKVVALAVTGGWDDDGPVVLTVYLDHDPTPEDIRAIEEIEPVLAVSAALIEFCAGEVVKVDQLVGMLEYRRVIEQAKGMIMATRRCDAASAFRTLVSTSQHYNIKLRELAVATVEHVGHAPAESGAEEQLTPPADAARKAAAQMWNALRSG